MKKRNTKAFISWSGALGECLGNRIREWLPIICPGLSRTSHPRMGRPAIGSERSRRSHDADLALVCVTRDTLASPWLHFETGALWLSKSRPSITLVAMRVQVQGILLDWDT